VIVLIIGSFLLGRRVIRKSKIKDSGNKI